MLTKNYGFALLFGLTTAFLSAQSAPNVIIIVSDDQGWGDVGFDGQGHPQQGMK